MTVPNACFIFLIAFSGITGWLMLRDPAEIKVVGVEQQKNAPKQETLDDDPPAVALSDQQSIVRSRLDSIILPVVDLENAHLEEAVEFLRMRAIELASQRDAPVPSLSFTIRKSGDTPSEAKLINVYAEEISLTDALDLICEKADCHWEIDDHRVLIFAN